MAVEAVEGRAMAGGAGGSPKDEAKAKAKSKAKLEDAEALTARTRTRTRTGPGKAPTLHQGRPTLSPLEGSKTRGLRPNRKHKRNKNKELSLATKMRTSVSPVNVPASCRWRTNCARRGWM